jgi:hypothetical protein
MIMKRIKLNASYKDPSGFVFSINGAVFRQVNQVYRENYDLLFSSGLYQELVQKQMLVKHDEVDQKHDINAYKIIQPEALPFITYPYEWCFSQLKDAALLTLNIQKIALKHGMSLKDATSFNVQFKQGRPIFIDTLSFEKYIIGKPWTPYLQFCEQFLAPLSLSSYTDLRLNPLVSAGMGSIPLDLAARLLPWRSFLNFGILTHIFLHVQSQKRVKHVSSNAQENNSFSKLGMLGLIDSLEQVVSGLKFPKSKTVWTDYANPNECPSYENNSLFAKKELVKKFIFDLKSKYVWDIGANTGIFSRIAAKQADSVISMDFDPTVVEANYLEMKANRESNILPLIVNITNPTPSVGWASRERDGLLSRPHPDTVLALALIHHLVFTYNIPLDEIAKFMASICQNLIIEFVAKSDLQVKQLLHNRQDIFDNYKLSDFIEIFSKYFSLVKAEKLPNSDRTIFLFKIK